MSSENESSPSGVVLDSPEVSIGKFRKSRICYSRGLLLFLADVDAYKELPDRFDQSILSELAYSSTPEQQQLHTYNPYSSGGTSGSSRESAERWDSYKLSPKDSNSTPKESSERWDCYKLSQKDSNSSSKESAERWDSCKLSPNDGNLADNERWTCNRSRQLLQNSGNTGNLRSPMQEHIGILGSWSASKILRDGSDDSTSHLQEARPSLLSRCSEPYRPPAFYKATSHSVEQKHNSVNHETSKYGKDPSSKRATEERWRKDSLELLEDTQLTENKEQLETSVGDRKEESDPDVLTLLQECLDGPKVTLIQSHLEVEEVQQLPSESQTGPNSGGIGYEEKLQEQILEECPFFSLVDLEETENIDPGFPAKKNIVAKGDNFKSQSKFLHWFLDNETESSNILSSGDKNGKKPWTENTALMEENRLSKETSPCAQRMPLREVRKANVEQNRFIPYGSSNGSRLSWEPHLDRSNRNIISNSKSSESKSVPKCSSNADLNIEILLPDEDSLIKIDDTYIFQQDMRTPSSNTTFKGERTASPSPNSNKLVKSENLHHNLTFQDPWSLESQRNAQKLFVNPFDSRAHLNAPHTFQDPWSTYRYGHNPLAPNLISHPFGHLSVKPPHAYEPPVQHFLSPRMHQADRYYPHPHSAISPESSIFHQAHQTPYRRPEPIPLRSPHSYPRNVNPALELGRRAMLGDEGNKSAFCHLLQMQMRLAQMNLEAASSSEEGAYGKPISNRFW